ncbi:TetR/AcrR family transcriptional regulator [Lampropedia aestuarii]|uniref:TetR/AcrR family transcriptional regulator n=2 Tax=Lampropedia aestuarii TaxID=2562762 RepID=A0A4S5BRS0_9BURK|nr:TetR/AcrR family transcriptional regulator [Lampropedia aestuarii]
MPGHKIARSFYLKQPMLDHAPESSAVVPDKVSLPNKRQQTRHAILNAAMRLVAQVGLEGLSIGGLADEAGMSKSGVFAHFGSREELQIAVVAHYHQNFQDEVFWPALKEPRGLPRLERMVRLWMQRIASTADSGIFISGAVDFDDRPGPVRDALKQSVRTWMSAVQRAVSQSQAEGQLRRDIEAQQMVFEIHGLILVLHYDKRFLQSPKAHAYAEAALQRLLDAYTTKAP